MELMSVKSSKKVNKAWTTLCPIGITKGISRKSCIEEMDGGNLANKS